MGEKRWTGRAARAQEAASNATSRMRGAVSQGAARTAARARGVGGAIGGMAATVPQLIADIEGPTVPLQEAWSVGLGQILSTHPRLWDGLRSGAVSLDRLGYLEISPDAISFDHNAVAWDEITEIKFGPAVDVVTSHALHNEIGRLTARLPPMPGRDWLVRQAVEVLVALCLATVGTVPDEDADTTSGAVGDRTPMGVPVMITYGSAVRPSKLVPGVFVALIAASIPSVSQAIAQIARERGIKVTFAPPSRSRQHAITMRKVAGSLSGRLRHGSEPQALEGGTGRKPTDLDDGAVSDTDISAGDDRPSAEGRMWTPGNWDRDDFEFDLLSTDEPSNEPPAQHRAQPIAHLADPPELVAEAALGVLASGPQVAAEGVGDTIIDCAPGSSGVMFSNLLPRK